MSRLSAGLKVPVAGYGGELLWVHEAVVMAELPSDLHCVGCGGELMLRRGEHNRPHFAHKGSGGCSGETALHKMAIEVIARSISSAASGGRAYPVELPCKRCCATKVGNLARHRGLTIERDRVLDGGIRPDLLIRSQDGAPRFVIEVIVSHAPEPAARALYERMALPLISIWPEWDTLEELRDGFSSQHLAGPERPASSGRHGLYDVDGYPCRSPRHFHHSDNPSCPTCNAKATRRVAIEIATSRCYKCRVPTAILDIVENAPLRLRRIAAGCPDLKGVDAIGARYGIELRTAHSATAGSSYLAHHCRNGHLQGDNFIYDAEGVLDRQRAVQHMTVCAGGHWVDDGPPRSWPNDTIAERVVPVVGLTGQPAGMFSGRTGPRVGTPWTPQNRIGRMMAFGTHRNW